MNDYNDHPMVRQIVGRVHVGRSNREAIRYFISRLAEKRDTWRTLSRSERKAWMRAVIHQHQRNRHEYTCVMRGKF